MRSWVLLPLLVLGCGHPKLPPALGSYSNVSVCAAPTVAASVLDTLARSLEEPVTYLSRSELRFRLQRVDPSRLEAARSDKNLILIAPENGVDVVSQEVRDLLRDAGSSAQALPMAFRDVYARGQLVLVFAAGDDSLAVRVAAVVASLGDFLETSVRQRIQESALGETRVEARRRQLERDHGFALRVPASYRLVPLSDAWPNAVEFVCQNPVRTLTVFWLEPVDSLQASSPGFVLGLQRDVLWRLHGDTLRQEDLQLRSGRLGTISCQVLEGIWQNRQDVGGGVVHTSFVHDADRRRLYGVQVQLFAPGHEQHPHVRELLAWAETFRIAEKP